MPRTVTDGRAVIGLAAMRVVRRNAGASKARGYASHSGKRFSSTLLRGCGGAARFDTFR
jgi:hypothetical protein